MSSSKFDGLSGEVKLRYEEALSQLCLVGRMNENLARLDDMAGLCLSIVGAVIEFTTSENCSIMLMDQHSGDLKLFVAKGRGDKGTFLGTEKVHPSVFSPGEGVAGYAFEKKQMVCIDDCDEDSRFVEVTSAVKEVNSVICAPIISDNSVLGVINCSHSKKRQFTETDKQNVSLVADHASALLERAMFLEQCKSELKKNKRELNEKSQKLSEADQQLADLEEQLYKSEKFITLGELLAGVAHELNNRVAPILIYSQMLQQTAETDDDKRRLHVIEESAMGAKAILETLLNFSRPGKEDKEPVNLNQTALDTLTLIEYKMRNHGIELTTELCPELPPTYVNEKKLSQVFLNIANNAVHAMEGTGGKLKIDSTYSRNAVTFTVSDSGPGIPEEFAEKIFDPFFTTKESGKGTGLGLSLSKRYVEEHMGHMKLCQSDMGGASFIIEIPRMDIKEEEPNDTANGTIPLENTAKILVVDDDSAIRDVIRDVLGPSYAVEFAVDGRDATEKIDKGIFDLLVVDYHMPGLDGKQLYEWVAGRHPSLKERIIFSTGDIYHENTRDFIESTGCSYLIKPFSTANLRELVSGALGVKMST